MGWKETKREQGFKDVLVWLEPAAVEALEQLKAVSPGLSVADLVSRAVILAAGMEPPVVAGHVAGGPDPEVVGIKEQLVSIEERLARVEASITTTEEHAHHEPDLEAEAPQAVLPPIEQESDHQAQAAGADADPAPLNGGGRVDPAPLLEAVADKVEQVGGWEWNITALYRELEAKGVKVQGLPRNFCTWVKKHHAAVEAILDQRRADRGEG